MSDNEFSASAVTKSSEYFTQSENGVFGLRPDLPLDVRDETARAIVKGVNTLRADMSGDAQQAFWVTPVYGHDKDKKLVDVLALQPRVAYIGLVQRLNDESLEEDAKIPLRDVARDLALFLGKLGLF